MRIYGVQDRYRSHAAWLAITCSLGLLFSSAFGGKAKKSSTAERLVEEARIAQLDGEASRQFALLRKAVRIAPDYDLARWYLGQVQVDGQWMAVEEAQRRAAADPKQSEYRELRSQYGESPQGQLALARWCRKNDLDEEARFHWASVLSVDPNHEEAMRATGMRWHNGRLLTREEVADQKQQLRDSKRAAKKWKPMIARWRRDVSGSDSAKRDAALDEFRSLADPDAIPVLEQLTLGRDASRENNSDDCRQISLAIVEALGKTPGQATTHSLVRHAVLPADSGVRTLATCKLKSRPLHDFVPLLLSGLAMPIESSFHVTTDSDGSVHYRHVLYRVGPTADWAIDTSHGSWQHFAPEIIDLPGEDPNVLTPRDINRRFAKVRQLAQNAARYQQEYSIVAFSVEQQVAHRNHQGSMLNNRIAPVLEQTTGEDFGASPRKWWDWWQSYNEYYVPDERPVYERHYVDFDHHYYPPPTQMSCFAKGTLVWTKTGQQPIETLELGDLVLSQDVNTGELKYQPVIGRTVRPPTSILKLSFDGIELRTTLGHPLWVAGVGWRMAKELGDGAILHGVSGAPRVEAIGPDGEEEAYNLVVADFNTYFVGERGILVHDNTPRRPTRATVPGLASTK